MWKKVSKALKSEFVIYGNGKMAHLLYALLAEENRERLVAAFVVSESTGEDEYLHVPVVTADRLKQEYAEYPVLIGVENGKAREEILEKLKELGVSNYILPTRAMLEKCHNYHKKCRKRKVRSLLGFWGGLLYRILYWLHKRVYIKIIGKRVVRWRIFNKYKLSMRLFSRDLDFFENIYIGDWNSDNTFKGEYDFEIRECDTVFDFGANIGLFTMRFAHFFPEIKFIAVEPEESNYKLLERNLSSFENVRYVKSGVWYRDAYCKVFPGRTRVFPSNTLSEGSFYIGECASDAENAIESFSVGSWIERYHSAKCVIKMDVEGAEKEIFELGNLEWLDHCVQLIVEIHSKHRGDVLLEDKITGVMESRGFDWFLQGENIIFVKKIQT